IRPLPYPQSERLVALREAKLLDDRSRTFIAPGRIEDWQQQSQAFDGIAGVYEDTFTDTTGASPERIAGATVSPQFFTVLGTSPAVGRVFSADEERFGGPLAVVISDGFWKRRFSGDPNVIGKTAVLSGMSYTIVGVMPAPFQYPRPETEVWSAKQARPELMRIREARFYAGIGRLKQGVSVERAQADLALVQKRLGEKYPKT